MISALELAMGVAVAAPAIVLPVICLLAVALVCHKTVRSLLTAGLLRRRQEAPA